MSDAECFVRLCKLDHPVVTELGIQRVIVSKPFEYHPPPELPPSTTIMLRQLPAEVLLHRHMLRSILHRYQEPAKLHIRMSSTFFVL